MTDTDRIELAKRAFAQAHDCLQSAIMSGDQRQRNLALVDARDLLRDAAIAMSWAFDKERGKDVQAA